ncbi:MAG: hypothetical protein WAZ94_06360 [Phycisphaerales bacterium]
MDATLLPPAAPPDHPPLALVIAALYGLSLFSRRLGAAATPLVLAATPWLPPLIVAAGAISRDLWRAASSHADVRAGATGVYWPPRIAEAPFRAGLLAAAVSPQRRVLPAVVRSPLAPAGSARTALAGLALGQFAWAAFAAWLAHAVFRAAGLASSATDLAGLRPWCILPFLALVTLAPAALTRDGRRSLRVGIARTLHHEWWPAWVFYLPLLPYALYLGLRHRGLTLFTCCNPGIENGGGWVGESKHAIMQALGDHPAVLPTILIRAGNPDERLASLLRGMQSSPRPIDFPVILKPNAGQRGHAVKLARSPEEARGYLAVMTAPAACQPYHPGPAEFGVLWARTPGSPRAGRIYSINRKTFPVLLGDGSRTIEALIAAHPRFRVQAELFLTRLGDACLRVPAPGEPVRLSLSGNHAQGTLFSDGADLISPELERTINQLASDFAGGLDLGRFDIRCPDEASFKRGEALAIIELNGVTSEPANLYDPARTTLWAYGVLFGVWNRLYTLGAERRRAGAKPLSLTDLRRLNKAYEGSVSGSSIAD